MAKKSRSRVVKPGYLYIVTSPTYPEWTKVGLSIDPKKRLGGYNCHTPMKDFTLYYEVYRKNGRLDEEKTLEFLQKIYPTSGQEWFRGDKEEVKKAIIEFLLIGENND